MRQKKKESKIEEKQLTTKRKNIGKGRKPQTYKKNKKRIEKKRM